MTLGDITDLDVDAIVNAANVHLTLGGGVAGAIRRKGGPAIQEECNKIGGTFVGGAVATTGGDLKAKYVIHAVGPQMGEGNEDEKLKNATLNSLKRAEEKGVRTIAFPAISTGIFGFPINRCAKIMLANSKQYLEGETLISRVIFCLFDKQGFDVFASAFKKNFSKHLKAYFFFLPFKRRFIPMQSERFGSFLVNRGVVSEGDILEALDLQRKTRPPIGKIALFKKLLTMKQVVNILNEQCDTHKLFGEIAVELGFLKTEDVEKILEIQKKEGPLLGDALVKLGKMEPQALERELGAYSSLAKST